MVLEDPGTQIPLGPNLRRRATDFYYPVLFLDSIHECCQQAVPRKVADSPQNPNQSSEADFQTLVNKLAHVCNYRPGGDTVTALTVLQADGVDGMILYAFASNGRKRRNLIDTKDDLLSVLTVLKDNLEASTKQPDHIILDRLLRQILRFNTVRVQCYFSSLSKNLEACVQSCTGDAAQNSDSSSRALQKLINMIPKTDKAGQTSDVFIAAVIRCIGVIEQYRKSSLQNFIKRRAANEEKLRKRPTPWSNLHHLGGRLLSYKYDAETLISAHHMWEDTDLFRNFEVNFLDSSESNLRSPLQFNEQTTPETIINSIPASICTTAQKKILLQNVKELSQFELNERLNEQWQRKLSPIVHAEVLLHDWLSRTPGALRPARFFGGWQYVGTSKPVCRLCRYYFDIIATPVQFRDGHPNAYPNWRLPDIRPRSTSPQDVQEANDEWREIMDQLKVRVYADLRRVLVEKATDKKMNDSNTYTDRISLAGLYMGLKLE